LSKQVGDGGHGGRTFVNNIGAAWKYFPENLTHDFFDSQIVCFGGTFLEKYHGGKLEKVPALQKEYMHQIGNLD
jgi:hypothetical protein